MSYPQYPWNPDDPQQGQQAADPTANPQLAPDVPTATPAPAQPPDPGHGYQQPVAPYPPYPAGPAAVSTPPYQAGPYPAQPAGLPAADPILIRIGDIQLSASTVYTPAGQVPLSETTWVAHDRWTTSQRTPTWAVVCSIVGFFCLTVFSLLFLLAKETVYSGVVTVVVTSGGFQYQTHLPISDPSHAYQVHQQVQQAQALALQSRG